MKEVTEKVSKSGPTGIDIKVSGKMGRWTEKV
jgi:ribosomal protein S3